MVSVFICQPFTTRATVGTLAMIDSRPSAAARSRARLTAGSSLSGSKAEPALRPIRRIRATIG